jgi:hypothetical protein
VPIILTCVDEGKSAAYCDEDFGKREKSLSGVVATLEKFQPPLIGTLLTATELTFETVNVTPLTGIVGAVIVCDKQV